MEYRIIKADSVWKLESEVQEWIEKGWKPHGNMSFTRVNIDPPAGFFGMGTNEIEEEYCQPMIKEA